MLFESNGEKCGTIGKKSQRSVARAKCTCGGPFRPRVDVAGIVAESARLSQVQLTAASADEPNGLADGCARRRRRGARKLSRTRNSQDISHG